MFNIVVISIEFEFILNLWAYKAWNKQILFIYLFNTYYIGIAHNFFFILNRFFLCYPENNIINASAWKCSAW